MGGIVLKSFINKYKRTITLIVIIIFIIAGILDIMFEGLLYQLLPHSIQSYLAEFF